MKPRKRRCDSFLGVHFDFHATLDDHGVGARTTPESIQKVIDAMHPDYIQCDTKGHPGIASFRTKYGTQAPDMVGDPLKIWRQVTADNGVALFAHYSGVYEKEAIRLHPEWGRLKPDGTRDTEYLNFYNTYLDDILIPQLKELALEYGLDGVWVDGECWAVAPDYGEDAQKEFCSQTGLPEMPKDPADDNYPLVMEFFRNKFHQHLKKYVDEVHAACPTFQIASNWMYTNQSMEKPVIDVDYISGDYPWLDSFNEARYLGRAIQHQGKPWDLMAWGFTGAFDSQMFMVKTPIQLKQEAAAVMCLGGGVQFYYTQNRDGSVKDTFLDVFKETAEFCREREKFCHQTESASEIALLFSGYCHHRTSRSVFGAGNGGHDAIIGTLYTLLDSQNPVDILSDLSSLEERLDKYRLLIVPEWEQLAPETIARLVAFCEAGGKLLLIGAKTNELFAEHTGIRYSGIENQKIWLKNGNTVFCTCTDVGEIADLGKAEVLANWQENEALYDTALHPAVTAVACGKGVIAGMHFSMGRQYNKRRICYYRDFVDAAVKAILPDPIVQVTGSRRIDVAISRKDGKFQIHLVNSSGGKAGNNNLIEDEIPPVQGLQISVYWPEGMPSIRLQPENKSLTATREGDRICFNVEEVPIYSIVELE